MPPAEMSAQRADAHGTAGKTIGRRKIFDGALERARHRNAAVRFVDRAGQLVGFARAHPVEDHAVDEARTFLRAGGNPAASDHRCSPRQTK
jgi:hypothetical protein